MSKNKPVFIDSDVPIPPQSQTLPIAGLTVGDSILFTRDQLSKVQVHASRLKRDKGMEFTVRVVDQNNCRVWRVA